MSLTDIMSHMNLDTYPIVALMIFLAVFVSVLVRLFRRRNDAGLARAAMLPLCDDASPPPPSAASND